MKKENKKLLKSNLSSLVKKFSKSDVISDMEKEYQTASAKLFKAELIDDNSYLKKAKISDSIISAISDSIKETGLKSPLILRAKKDHYELVLGRKRLLASKYGKVELVPAVVINLNDEEMLLMLLADNRDQRNPNVIETALLCNELVMQFKYTRQTLADITHQSRSQITNIMRLLNLPDSIIRDISVGKLSYGHAKAIASLPESVVLEVVGEVYSKHLSVRQIEQIVGRYKSSFGIASDEENALSIKYHSLANIKKRSVAFSFSNEEDKRLFVNALLDKE
ncbi:MAG: ParB/RepB/Spo0J family partition protein [Bacilli bacterium]|jgi:ParB family chromosome partitioning protein